MRRGCYLCVQNIPARAPRVDVMDDKGKYQASAHKACVAGVSLCACCLRPITAGKAEITAEGLCYHSSCPRTTHPEFAVVNPGIPNPLLWAKVRESKYEENILPLIAAAAMSAASDPEVQKAAGKAAVGAGTAIGKGMKEKRKKNPYSQTNPRGWQRGPGSGSMSSWRKALKIIRAEKARVAKGAEQTVGGLALYDIWDIDDEFLYFMDRAEEAPLDLDASDIDYHAVTPLEGSFDEDELDIVENWLLAAIGGKPPVYDENPGAKWWDVEGDRIKPKPGDLVTDLMKTHKVDIVTIVEEGGDGQVTELDADELEGTKVADLESNFESSMMTLDIYLGDPGAAVNPMQFGTCPECEKEFFTGSGECPSCGMLIPENNPAVRTFGDFLNWWDEHKRTGRMAGVDKDELVNRLSRDKTFDVVYDDMEDMLIRLPSGEYAFWHHKLRTWRQPTAEELLDLYDQTSGREGSPGDPEDHRGYMEDYHSHRNPGARFPYGKGKIPRKIEKTYPFSKIARQFKKQYGPSWRQKFYPWLRGVYTSMPLPPAEPARGRRANPTRKQAKHTAEWHRARGRRSRVLPTAGGFKAYVGGPRWAWAHHIGKMTKSNPALWYCAAAAENPLSVQEIDALYGAFDEVSLKGDGQYGRHLQTLYDLQGNPVGPKRGAQSTARWHRSRGERARVIPAGGGWDVYLGGKRVRVTRTGPRGRGRVLPPAVDPAEVEVVVDPKITKADIEAAVEHAAARLPPEPSDKELADALAAAIPEAVGTAE